MLGKLIKHDFRSLSRILLPTQLAILGATVIATAGFAFNMRTELVASMQNTGIQILRLIAGFMSVIMLLAIIAASFLVAFIIFQRFYKNFMCDEGYLTFTLPVTTAQLLWSKLITAMLWSLISSVVIFICVNIFILFGTSTSSFINLEFYRQLGEFCSKSMNMMGGKLVLPAIELVVLTIISAAFNILHIYLSLIIGGVVSQKHKLLAGIGFYFAINIAVGILSTIGQFLISGSFINTMNTMPDGNIMPAEGFGMVISAMQPFVLFYFILTAALTVGFFILSHYLLKNKLNLE